MYDAWDAIGGMLERVQLYFAVRERVLETEVRVVQRDTVEDFPQDTSHSKRIARCGGSTRWRSPHASGWHR